MKLLVKCDPGMDPVQAHPGDAGMDLRAARDGRIGPGERMLVPTGVRVAVGWGHEIQIRPRSGLALKHGVTILNTPGTIDEGYRGEIKIIMINHHRFDTFYYYKGDRLAQMVINELPIVNVEYVDVLPESQRGAQGFGSTGV